MKNALLLPFLFTVINLFSQPTTDGLICWFPFNGNANDESNNNHHATAFGATLTEDRHGNPNAAYFFDGEDDYIMAPDHPALRLGNTSFVISAWVRPDALNDSQAHSIMSKRTGAGNQGFLFQLIGTNHIMELGAGTIDVVSSGGWDDPKITSFTSLSIGTWHHVLYCYDSETQKGQFFIDNVPDNISSMINLSPSASGDLFIGKDKLTDGNYYPDIEPDYIGGYYFFGAIDDIRIYDRKLDRGEIAMIYGEGTSKVNDTHANYSFKPYPTLIGQYMNIETNCPFVKTVSIHDANGRLLLHTAFSNRIDCQQLPIGSHLVSFFDEQDKLIWVEKIVKQ